MAKSFSWRKGLLINSSAPSSAAIRKNGSACPDMRGTCSYINFIARLRKKSVHQPSHLRVIIDDKNGRSKTQTINQKMIHGYREYARAGPAAKGDPERV